MKRGKSNRIGHIILERKKGDFLVSLFEFCCCFCLLYGGGLVFDSSIIFIKFHNYSKIHFNKKSFRVVKSKIEMIDVDFIKVDKTD